MHVTVCDLGINVTQSRLRQNSYRGSNFYVDGREYLVKAHAVVRAVPFVYALNKVIPAFNHAVIEER